MSKLTGITHIRSELELLTFDVELGSVSFQGQCHFCENGQGTGSYVLNQIGVNSQPHSRTC